MNSYVLVKNTYPYDDVMDLSGGIHMSFSKIQIPLLYIYNEDLQKQVITTKVIRKYQKLLKMVTFYFNCDDDTGVAYQEAFSEIQRFYQILKNKYRKYVLEEKLEEIEKTLFYLEKSAVRKLQILGRHANLQERGRGAK